MEAQNNRKRISKIAVKSGVPLDAANKQGQTALHYCYGYGYFELGKYLAGPLGARTRTDRLDPSAL